MRPLYSRQRGQGVRADRGTMSVCPGARSEKRAAQSGSGEAGARGTITKLACSRSTKCSIRFRANRPTRGGRACSSGSRPAICAARGAIRPTRFTRGTRSASRTCSRQVDGYGCEYVEITGGEPLLQADVYPLMQELLGTGHRVMLETGGHRSIADVPAAVVKIVDVKCPASGESARNHWDNLDLLQPHDEVKFVIQDRADYEFARDVVQRHDLVGRTAAVLFSPVHDVLDPKAPRRLDTRGPPRRPAAAPDSQVHLGHGCEGGMTESEVRSRSRGSRQSTVVSRQSVSRQSSVDSRQRQGLSRASEFESRIGVWAVVSSARRVHS